ncbi:uncharacterized protein LOC101731001 isoform X1 [Xenopus tropicalis]|uniref:Uncharacterized protein LOC101731001 isoform X1 n=1 Tax=Xenopus tropicalis TaxID=8364 RepID=A0A8J1IYJ5_XENTR|nr:uncharacterized protein LOC101731001 isoform X1 [Xenopus tropicalis]
MDNLSNEGTHRRSNFTVGERLISCLSVVLFLSLLPFSVIGALVYFAARWICGSSLSRSRPSLSVTVFSRSAQTNYAWFLAQLKGETFKDLVTEAKPFYISNSNRYEFMDEMYKCNFAVLYHTKNHGRINITNVTDSLYDEELKNLSDALGKEKVIVLIDDLDKSGYGEKMRILEMQPDIKDLAQDMFLISMAEKDDPKLMEDRLHHIKLIMSSGPGAAAGPIHESNLCTYLFSMIAWLSNSIVYIMSVSSWQHSLSMCQCFRRKGALSEVKLNCHPPLLV